VQGRLLIVRNVLKCWLLLVVVAGLFGALGWELGGYRVSILFSGSIVLLAAAIYAYADRIVMGMLGARELLQAEAPVLHSTVERLSLRAGVVRPRLYVLADGYPRALSSLDAPYPTSAQTDAVRGTVTLLLSIDETGSVRDASVVSAEPSGYFETAALASVREARFAPAEKDARPVRSKIIVKLRFAPQEQASR